METTLQPTAGLASSHSRGSVPVPASSEYRKGAAIMDLTDGDSIAITWKNDEYVEGSVDANVQIRKIRLTRLESGSALAGYLKGTPLLPFQAHCYYRALQPSASSLLAAWEDKEVRKPIPRPAGFVAGGECPRSAWGVIFKGLSGEAVTHNGNPDRAVVGI